MCKKNNRGRLDPKAMYHTVAIKDATADDFERPAPKQTSASKAVAATGLPESLFMSGPEGFSLPDTAVEYLQADKPEWPNVNAERYRESSLRTLLMECFEADWDSMELSWLSLLAPVSHFVARKEDGHGGIVVRSTRDGFMRYRCKISRVPGKQIYDVESHGSETMVFASILHIDQ